MSSNHLNLNFISINNNINRTSSMTKVPPIKLLSKDSPCPLISLTKDNLKYSKVSPRFLLMLVQRIQANSSDQLSLKVLIWMTKTSLTISFPTSNKNTKSGTETKLLKDKELPLPYNAHTQIHWICLTKIEGPDLLLPFLILGTLNPFTFKIKSIRMVTILTSTCQVNSRSKE